MDPESIVSFTGQSGYICEIEKQYSDCVIFRLNIVDGKDADAYLNLFQTSTMTQWIRNGELKNPERVVYHKYYVCQHSTVNKKASSSTTVFNTGCQAKLDILIKKCTPGSKRNDKFLKMRPPLCGKVKVDLIHNHNIGTGCSLSSLKISDKTKMKFEDYFKNGMSPAEAIRYHESELMLNDKPWDLLANSSINPTKNVVYYLHKKWTLKNCGTDPQNENVNVQETSPVDQLNQEINFETSDEETAKRKAALSEISQEFQRLSTTFAGDIPSNVLQNFAKKLKKIKSTAQLYSAMNTASRSSIKTSAKIKVQPTSISRRRSGVTRGSTKIPSGRPLNGVTKRSKRKHNISLNISLNMPNATLHRRAH